MDWYSALLALLLNAMSIKRNVPLLASLLLGHSPLLAVDEILLKSGKLLTGTIVAQSKDQVFIKIGQGNAFFNKKAITRIYDDITNKRPVTEMLARDQLPPWWIPLSDLYSEDWVNSVTSIPATTIESGIFAGVPYLSFRINKVYELNIYGDPEKPAGIEIGFYGRGLHGRDARKRCRQFMASYLSDLRQIKALYAMDATGGGETLDGIRIEITPPQALDSQGGWWITLYKPEAVRAAARKVSADWEADSRRLINVVKSATDGQTAWQKWSLKDAVKRLVPMERMEER